MNKSLYPDMGAKIRADFVPAQYFDEARLHELEKKRLWTKTWQIACREEEVPNVGDFVNYEIDTESILVVRTKKDEIKAFYNVCQHRGRRLRDDARGNVAQGFYCRFHGWRYALNGDITYVHSKDDWNKCPDFKESNLNLKQPQVGFWGGFVWINMDVDAMPLIKYLGEIVPRLEHFELEKNRYAWYETIIAPVNWKVIVEAFNEGYHAGATHTSAVDYKRMDAPTHIHGEHSMYYTNFMSLPTVKRESGKWTEATSLQELLYYQSLEINTTLFTLVMDPLMKAMTRMKEETLPTDPPEQIIAKMWEWHKEEVKKAGLYWPEKLTIADMTNAGTGWHLFPNAIVMPSVDGFLCYRMRPYNDDPDMAIFDIWCLRPFTAETDPHAKQNITEGFEAFRGKNPFLEQDFDNMVAVNKGMKSQGWAGAVCSPREELQISHFHKVLRKYVFGDGMTIEEPQVSIGAKPKKAAAAKAKKPAKTKAKKPVKAKAKKPVKAASKKKAGKAKAKKR